MIAEITEQRKKEAETWRAKQLEAKRAISEAQEEIYKAEKQSALYEKLSGQETELALAKQKLEQLKKEKESLLHQWEQLTQERDQVLRGLDTKIHALEGKIATESQDATAKAKYEAIEAEIKSLELAIEAARNEIEALKDDKRNFEGKLKHLEEAEQKAALLSTRLKLFQGEMAEWEYLKYACGKDGIQALEIDAVAPAISSVANSLLFATYGPGFQVRLDTLDDKSRETLDIWVARPDGSECVLQDLSGGERVWVLKALRLARTIIAKEKSGRDLLTCFGDEEDGALRHGETSLNFIGLYREMMKVGGFNACFYISHKPECIDAADNRLVFTPGQGVILE